jgi:hypothetical protein
MHALALTFLEPWLLAGLLAAGIPFVLHLLSSVRAQEVNFPTLRFMQLSMEKTAHRRRIQHWLLLLLRAALLAMLALAVAQPISKATGNWLGGNPYAAVVILDNGMSMSTRCGGGNRLAQAKAQAQSLLGGDKGSRPAMVALLTTSGGGSSEMTASLPRNATGSDGVSQATVGYGAALLGRRLATAIDMLAKQPYAQKSIYIFSDLQKARFEDPSVGEALSRAKDVHLFVINAAGSKPVDNVGITDLEITGRRVVDSTLEFAVTLVNSSPAERVVDVALGLDGVSAPLYTARKSLSASGKAGATGTVHFRHRFAKPGQVIGEVHIAPATGGVPYNDDLAADNVRRFCLDIGGRVKSLVVSGSGAASVADVPPASSSGALPVDAEDHSLMVGLALDPFDTPVYDDSVARPIIKSATAARDFSAGSLSGMDAVYFCDVPSFTPAQAQAIAKFAQGGGTCVLFLGPGTQLDNYNKLLLDDVKVEGGLLPGKLAPAVGQVGLDADATRVDYVDTEHPYFAGLHKTRGEYLGAQVQRYYRLEQSPRPSRVLMRLSTGEPLMLEKPFGQGRVVLCLTTASAQWTNLPLKDIFLCMVSRMSLLARQDLWRDNMYLPDATVTIRPPPVNGTDPADLPGAKIKVTLPGEGGAPGKDTVTLDLAKTAQGTIASFNQTALPGIYTWELVWRHTGVVPYGQPANVATTAPGATVGGTFVVNPVGRESVLDAASPPALAQTWNKLGVKNLYIADTLDQANQQAAAQSKGRNWWDTLAALAILLLVAEALFANRPRRQSDAVPARFNPKSS